MYVYIDLYIIILFLRWSLSLNPDLADLVRLADWQTPVILLSLPSQQSVTGVCHHSWHLMWVLGIQTQVLMLYGKHATHCTSLQIRVC